MEKFFHFGNDLFFHHSWWLTTNSRSIQCVDWVWWKNKMTLVVLMLSYYNKCLLLQKQVNKVTDWLTDWSTDCHYIDMRVYRSTIVLKSTSRHNHPYTRLFDYMFALKVRHRIPTFVEDKNYKTCAVRWLIFGFTVILKI